MSEPRSWFVLLHRPGPALAAGQSVFDRPGIGLHHAFLRDRVADGTLVAAGPLTDEAGSGMTVLAVGTAEEAARPAREVDQSVVEGILQVTVRPWSVVMTPIAG